MALTNNAYCAAIAAAVIACVMVPARAQSPQQPRQGLKEPVYRVSKANNNTAAPKPAEHPLDPAIRFAQNGLDHIQKDVKDYTCTLVKRERINGKLLEHEYIYAKVRQEKVENGRVVTPFSVYLYFLAPDKMKGRECIYVKGKNEGKLYAHEGGTLGKIVPAMWLDPTAKLAMRGNRYPITETGVEVLTRRLIEVAQKDRQYGECEVQFFNGAKINGRVCTCIEVVHPVPRRNFLFHLARIFVDKEFNLPIRYESYDWPKEAGGAPELLEEYTYLNLKLNNGFTDADFDIKNPSYKFR